MKPALPYRLIFLLKDFIKRNHAAINRLNSSYAGATIHSRIEFYEEQGQFAGWQLSANGILRFIFSVDGHLQPTLENASGELLSFPLPIHSASALDEKRILWRTNKACQQFRELMAEFYTQLAEVLEAVMLDEAQWSVESFCSWMMNSRLLVGVAQRIVWGVYDDNELMQTFRIAEDKTLVNADDVNISLPQMNKLKIGIIHPIILTTSTCQTWGIHLQDYLIVQVFSQIGRPSYTLTNLPDMMQADNNFIWSSENPNPPLHLRERHWTGWWMNASWRYDFAQTYQRSQVSGWMFYFIKRYFPLHDIRLVINLFYAHERELIAHFETTLGKMDLTTVPPMIFSEAIYFMQGLLRHDA